MEIIQFFIDLLRDPRTFIAGWIESLGSFAYAPLFAIVFVETGLVIMPFLPGDSLLFTAGLFAAPGFGLNLGVLITVLILAAVLGNTSNYWIGRKVGQVIIDSGRVKSLTPERIEETQRLFDKYGPFAIVVTRFFPFFRTFAPFIAGVGKMHFARFTLFNVIGGVGWVVIFTLLGYFFGNIPFVQENFQLVIVAIVLVSLIPLMVGAVKARLNKRREKTDQEPEGANGNESTSCD
ncbi:MAG: VTT domain-containing protein [Coriobacteriia bacterium]|nr:VTT domain-containing protein [Coriobacteriia bacterium]